MRQIAYSRIEQLSYENLNSLILWSSAITRNVNQAKLYQIKFICQPKTFAVGIMHTYFWQLTA